jgi:hypothetical protein
MVNDALVGSLKLTGLPELACVKDINDLVRWIADHTVVDFPGGIEQGVTVGPIQPTDPAATGIWVKTDSSGAFIGLYVFSGGSWVQIDLGGCQLASVSSGSALVCSGGVSQPLSGSLEGQVLTLIDATTGEAAYVSKGCLGPTVTDGTVIVCNTNAESVLKGGSYGDVVTLIDDVTGKAKYHRADDNKLSGSSGLVSIGSGQISSNIVVGPPSLTSSIVDVVITNNLPTRAKMAGLSTVGTITGFWNMAGAITGSRITTDLLYSFDGGGYTSLKALRTDVIPGVATSYYQDHQVSASLPILATLAPFATTTLHLKLTMSITSPGGPAAAFFIDGMYISALVTELTTA